MTNTLKMAFLGGSVTEGYPFDSLTEPYPTLVGKKLAGLLPNTDVTVDNFAVSGVTSTYGLFQAEDILRNGGYDVVFLEYAVNDTVSRRSVKAYESLMRKTASFDSHPIVVSIIVTTKEYKDAGEHIRKLCEYYEFPCVNIAAWLKKDIDAGKLCWKDYSSDNVHPNRRGHEYICNCICNCIADTIENHFGNTQDFHEIKPLKKPFFKADFENMKIEKIPESITFPYKISLNCKSFFIVFVRHLESDFGTVSVTVDGVRVKLLYGKNIFSWYYPVPVCVFDEENTAEHTVELQLTEKSVNSRFIIKYFGWA